MTPLVVRKAIKWKVNEKGVRNADRQRKVYSFIKY